MIKPWDKLDSEYLGDFRIFRIRADRSRSPRTGEIHRFFVLESPDWVNVIPLTPEGNVIMIRQYRHGTEDVTLEVPGGMVDATDADPSVSAGRELREETGYEAEGIVHLGTVAPNPAFLNNRCHSYLALGVRPVAAVELDGAEDILFEEIPLTAIPDLIRTGRITHSLTVTAFYYYELYEEAKKLTQRSQKEQRTQRENHGEVPENAVAQQIVDAAFHIHKRLGPGLLESAYEALLVHELRHRGLEVKQQVLLPITFDTIHIEAAYRIDLLVNDQVVVELKSVEAIAPVHQKQLLTYLKLSEKRLGLLINFGGETIKQGIKRVVNGLPG